MSVPTSFPSLFSCANAVALMLSSRVCLAGGAAPPANAGRTGGSLFSPVGQSPAPAAQNAPVQPQAAAADPVTAEPGPGRVPVVVESNGPSQQVALYLGNEQFGWTGYANGRTVYGTTIIHHVRPLCSTPCSMWAFPGELPLMVSGDGLRSATESLRVGPNGTRFHFRATAVAPFVAGIYLTIFGGTALITGGTLVGLGAAVDGLAACDYRGVCTPSTSGPSGLTWAGIGTLVGGVALLVPGIVLLATSRTGVASSEEFGAAPPARTGSRRVPIGERLSFGGGPLPNGGYVSTALRF